MNYPSPSDFKPAPL